MREGPWKLPDGWRWENLKEVAQIIQGKGVSKHEYSGQNTGFKILKFRDIVSTGEINWENNNGGFVNSAESLRSVELGDVLLTSAAHTPDQIGRKVAYLDLMPSSFSQVFFTGEIMAFRPLPAKLYGKWLRYWLASVEGFRQVQSQVKEKHLVRSRAENILIPSPLVQEQRRIVAKIEALFDRIREAKRLRMEAGENSESLMQAALKDIFDLPDQLPTDWRWAKVAEVGDSKREVVQTGPFGAQLKSSEFTTAGVPVLAIGNVKSAGLDLTELNHVSDAKARQLSRYKVKSGDLLFTRMGTVGRSCVVPDYADGWLISYHLLRIAVDHSCCLPKYLHYALTGSPRVSAQLDSRVQGATRAGVNTRILANLEFPLASIAEQRRIIRCMGELMDVAFSLKKSQQATESELKRLEQAILDRAFRGAL